jgi:hypothetical protein
LKSLSAPSLTARVLSRGRSRPPPQPTIRPEERTALPVAGSSSPLRLLLTNASLNSLRAEAVRPSTSPAAHAWHRLPTAGQLRSGLRSRGEALSAVGSSFHCARQT